MTNSQIFTSTSVELINLIKESKDDSFQFTILAWGELKKRNVDVPIDAEKNLLRLVKRVGFSDPRKALKYRLEREDSAVSRRYRHVCFEIDVRMEIEKMKESIKTFSGHVFIGSQVLQPEHKIVSSTWLLSFAIGYWNLALLVVLSLDRIMKVFDINLSVHEGTKVDIIGWLLQTESFIWWLSLSLPFNWGGTYFMTYDWKSFTYLVSALSLNAVFWIGLGKAIELLIKLAEKHKL